MFIRKKLKKNNKICIQIVHSIRDNNKISQKIIQTVGSVDLNNKEKYNNLLNLANIKLKHLKNSKSNNITNNNNHINYSNLHMQKLCLSNFKIKKILSTGIQLIVNKIYFKQEISRNLTGAKNNLMKNLIIKYIYNFCELKYNIDINYLLINKNFFSNKKTFSLLQLLEAKHTKIQTIITNNIQNILRLNNNIYVYFIMINNSATKTRILVFAANEFNLALNYQLIQPEYLTIPLINKIIHTWQSEYIVSTITIVDIQNIFKYEFLHNFNANGWFYISNFNITKIPPIFMQKISQKNSYKNIILHDCVFRVFQIQYNETEKLIAYYPNNKFLMNNLEIILTNILFLEPENIIEKFQHAFSIYQLFSQEPPLIQSNNTLSRLNINFFAYEILYTVIFKIKVINNNFEFKDILSVLLSIKAIIVKNENNHHEYLMPIELSNDAKQILELFDIEIPNLEYLFIK